MWCKNDLSERFADIPGRYGTKNGFLENVPLLIICGWKKYTDLTYGEEMNMKKGKLVKICGVSVYREYERKSPEERGRIRRPAVFRSKKDYNRNKAKKEMEAMKKTF